MDEKDQKPWSDLIYHDLLNTFAKGFLHDGSHKLSSLSFSLRNLSRNLEKQGKNDQSTQEILNKIIKIGESLDSDFRRFKEFYYTSTKQNERNEKINLRSVVNEAISLFDRNITRVGATVKVHDEGFDKPIFGNKKQLIHSLINIIQNSLDSRSPNRKIVISINIKTSDKNQVIEISDNGVGIPKDRIESIFQPGYSTKESGTGFGLFLVKNIIEEAHNGSVTVASSPDGTSVKLAFPKYGS